MIGKNDFGYIGYQEMIADITSALDSTGEVMNRLELSAQAEQAKTAASRIKSHIFSVGIMGEFKRGKSTVINALLGREIAPSDVVPASATLNRITYGLTPKATILYKDGHSEEVPVDQIGNYVTKITESSAATAALVDQAVVEYPCQFCQNNVEIIDTPGLNDDDRMDAISESVIPKLDAVVLVLAANSPFSKSEAEFVRDKLMTSDVSRLIIVVNRIDCIYSEKDRVRLLDSIREKIVKEILSRTASIHGEDSKLYQDTRDKLADIKLYPLSAIQALVGRVENDPALVEKSGILAFEDRLRKLLTQERGVLELIRASGVITTLLDEGEKALNLRMSALEMSTEEFLKNQKEAEQQIKELREAKKEEKARLYKKGIKIRNQMCGIVDEKYADLEQRLGQYLDTYPIQASDLKTEAGQKALQARVRDDMEKEIRRSLSEYTEQINVSLQESIGDERLKVQKYMGDLSGQLAELNRKISGNSTLETACVVGVDALSNLVAATFTGIFSAGGFGLMGLGGMIQGYRAAGAKGAATGLLGGFGASGITAIALIGAMGAVPFIPFALITGIAGTMGGKLLTSVIWGKDIERKKIAEIRSSLKKTAEQSVHNLQDQNLLENWAQKQVEAQIDDLVSQVEQESEAMISSMEDTLKAIAADIVRANQNKEQQMEEYKKLETKMKGIGNSLIPIMEKVKAVSQQMT